MSVLEKASDVIDCLGQAGEPVTLAHVRSALSMPKSSTHRLLSELAALGIVRRTHDGRYSLGPRLLYWGEAAAETFDLRATAEPTMRRLRDTVGESVHLYVRDGDTRICIAAVEARHELRPFIQLGRPLPLRAGAAGKVLLAFAEEDVQRQELELATSDRKSWPNAPAADLAEQLERVRRFGWATSIAEREDGVAAVASTVVDSTGRVVAALCISGPTTRLRQQRLDEMSAPLMAAADELSQHLRRG
jgi:DNA-binding IclR family transcriptional regulator